MQLPSAFVCLSRLPLSVELCAGQNRTRVTQTDTETRVRGERQQQVSPVRRAGGPNDAFKVRIIDSFWSVFRFSALEIMWVFNKSFYIEGRVNKTHRG